MSEKAEIVSTLDYAVFKAKKELLLNGNSVLIEKVKDGYEVTIYYED